VASEGERGDTCERKKEEDGKTVFQGKYSQEVEEQMKSFYETLSEKEKRRYAALEAGKLGHGGQKYICTLLGCSPTTLRVGREEIMHGSAIPKGHIRKSGGGTSRFRVDSLTVRSFAIANSDHIYDRVYLAQWQRCL